VIKIFKHKWKRMTLMKCASNIRKTKVRSGYGLNLIFTSVCVVSIAIEFKSFQLDAIE
jgi:hypothetical protein